MYVTNYYDGDNSKLSFTLNQTYPSSYNYLGTEKDAVSLDSSDNGNIVSIKGNSQLFGSFGEDNYKAVLSDTTMAMVTTTTVMFMPTKINIQ